MWSSVKSPVFLLDYVGCFSQTKISKILNATVDPICFKTRGRVFQTLKRVFQTLDRGFTEEIESSAFFLCYNTAHAVAINYAIMFEKKI